MFNSESMYVISGQINMRIQPETSDVNSGQIFMNK